MFDTRDGNYKDVDPGAGKAMDGSGPPVNKYRWNPGKLAKKLIVSPKKI
jgi:hypothetical protein